MPAFDTSNGDKCTSAADGELTFHRSVCTFVKGEMCGNPVVGGIGEVCLPSEIDRVTVNVAVLIPKEKGSTPAGSDATGDKSIETNAISFIRTKETEVVPDALTIGKPTDVTECCTNVQPS